MAANYKEYFIEYYSENIYQEPVTEGIFEFNVSPCNDDSQFLIEANIKQTLSDSLFRHKNLFGFTIHRIRTSSKFHEFSFHFKARVQKAKTQISAIPQLTIKEELDEILSDQFYIDHHLYLRSSPFTRLHEHQLTQIPIYGKDCSPLDFFKKLNKHVHSSMTYQKNITSVTTSACDALELSKGVCQDYAHVFIAMARRNGLPARYVSGYLHPGSEYVGASFMHAWVEGYIPGMGWIGFDPTNNMLVDENFIKVSHGADYADCSPIKGVLRTNGDHLMTSKVMVMDQ